MKVGQTIQTKIKNRWVDVVVKRINKTTIRVNTGTEELTVKTTEVRKKPTVKKTKKPVKKTITKTSVSKDTNTITKSRKTTDKPVIVKDVNVPKAGTKRNPFISLYDLRSHNLISSLDYETKVKFESIIVSLIKDM